MKISVVADASALILLEKIKLLDKLINELRLLIPKEIEKEAITVGKEKNYPDAFRLEEKVKNKLIKVMEVKDNQFITKIMNDFNLAKGEAEAIGLFNQEKADLIATDDGLAIRACRSLAIPFSGTCAFVTQAFENNLIKKEEAKGMIKTLAKEGRYKDEIIFSALNSLEEDKNEI